MVGGFWGVAGAAVRLTREILEAAMRPVRLPMVWWSGALGVSVPCLQGILAGGEPVEVAVGPAEVLARLAEAGRARREGVALLDAAAGVVAELRGPGDSVEPLVGYGVALARVVGRDRMLAAILDDGPPILPADIKKHRRKP